MTGSNITLYEVGVSDERSASPFVWRTKFSLARKGIPYRSEMVDLSDIAKLFDGRFPTVPIIDTGDMQMNESLALADWLDETYPDLPAIFSCPAERAMVGFFDQWLLHGVLIPGILPVYALDAHDCVALKDQVYYRQSREAFFGQTLEETVADREAKLLELRRFLEPVRQTVTNQPFIGGNEPNFADMCMLGLFIFVGTIATLPLLAGDDPLVAYADRGFASFGPETASLKLNLSEKVH